MVHVSVRGFLHMADPSAADFDYAAYGEEGEEGEDEDLGQPYRPPGNDRDGERVNFGHHIPRNFIVPDRLREKPYELIEGVRPPRRWPWAVRA